MTTGPVRNFPEPEPDAYVTKVSVPSFDDGVQRLRNHLKEPEGEPEPEA